jgi:alkylated DNA repair dioxygenase AlkB
VEQLSLLSLGAGGARTLVDDETGRIVYYPDVVGEPERSDWFAALLETTDWLHERRPMYDRIVDVPRLTSHFAPGDALPPPVLAAKAAVERFLATQFDSVGLNLYRDGRDSVAMHNDHLDECLPRSPIALLSLGGARIIRIHSKSRPRRVFGVALDPGSVFLMAGASQEHWEHGIPKTREPVAPRASLAFRQRGERAVRYVEAVSRRRAASSTRDLTPSLR